MLYQFKIDSVGDNVEHLVIQARFTGTGPNQLVAVAGPLAPSRTGTSSVLLVQNGLTTGTINQTFSPQPGVKVFAGAIAQAQGDRTRADADFARATALDPYFRPSAPAVTQHPYGGF